MATQRHARVSVLRDVLKCMKRSTQSVMGRSDINLKVGLKLLSTELDRIDGRGK